MSKVPNFVDVLRMYREERGLPYREALLEAHRHFVDKGWPIPRIIKEIAERKTK
jgi:hypothetical protein